jgi:hypothetical protein
LVGASVLACSIVPGSVARAEDSTPSPDAYSYDVEADVEEAPATPVDMGEPRAHGVPADEDNPKAPSESSEESEPREWRDARIPSRHAERHGSRPLPPLLGDPSARPAWRRNSPGAMAAGITLSTIGGLTTIVGAVFVAAASKHSSPSYATLEYRSSDSYAMHSELYYDSSKSKQLRAIGIGTMVFGLTELVIGIPLAVVGARKVPAKGDMIQIAVGPSSGSMVVHF